MEKQKIILAVSSTGMSDLFVGLAVFVFVVFVVASICYFNLKPQKKNMSHQNDERIIIKKSKGTIEEKLKPDKFMMFMCFFFPIMGFILYAFNVSESPKAAKHCATISLVSLILIIFVCVGIFT